MKFITLLILQFAMTSPSFGDQVSTSSRKTDRYCSKAPDLRIYELCQLVNQERSKRKLAPLTLDPELSEVIQAHTEEMADYKYLSHKNMDGEDPFDRLRRAGIRYQKAAENVAWGQRTPKDVMKSWMNSPGHRKNILGPTYRSIGLGFSGSYWGQVFTTNTVR